VAAKLARWADRGAAVGDVQTPGSPAAEHLVVVHLGAAGLGVVEIAPRERVDASDAELVRLGRELVQAFGVVPSGHGDRA
jgi:hypothetical protein